MELITKLKDYKFRNFLLAFLLAVLVPFHLRNYEQHADSYCLAIAPFDIKKSINRYGMLETNDYHYSTLG